MTYLIDFGQILKSSKILKPKKSISVKSKHL